MPDQPASAALENYVATMRLEHVPSVTVDAAKRVLLDGLGCILGSTSNQFPIQPLLLDFARRTSTRRDSLLIGSSLRSDCMTAALVNGVLAYYVDSEPHHPQAMVHPVAVVLPATLAVAEMNGSSGAEFLEALIVGIDVACHVSRALDGPTIYARGFHPTTVSGAFGAMAASAHLLHFKGTVLSNAFGLAGSQASGLLSWIDDPTEQARPLNTGFAARSGVSAAMLAASGLTGTPNIFGGKYPLSLAYSGTWNSPALDDDLGSVFAVDGLYFKIYPCCGFLHPALDGLLDILAAERIDATQIDAITLRFATTGCQVIDNNRLRSHCAQYILAVAAVNGTFEFSDVMNNRRNDPLIESLSRRVTVIPDAELEKEFPHVYRSGIEVRMRGGQTHTRVVGAPKGSVEMPLTEDELWAKFLRLTDGVLPVSQAEGVRSTTKAIDTVDIISTLTDLLEVNDPSGASNEAGHGDDAAQQVQTAVRH
jgi:2-methylcitrate dehydratase PrpD